MLSVCKALESISSTTRIKIKTCKIEQKDTANERNWIYIYRSICHAQVWFYRRGIKDQRD
jgi:hypothetical protein